MDVFRTIRTALKDDRDGKYSLSAFLYLISSIDKQQDNQTSPLLLPVNAREAFFMLPSNYQEECFSLLTEDLKRKNTPLNIDLMLRHSAGRLFEEANLYAHIYNESLLFPIPNLSYSSEYQNQLGSAVYTPNYVARTIVEESLKNFKGLYLKDEITIFDPACGSGVFISA